MYRGAAGGWHCFRMNVERKNLPCNNHRGVLCGKENMPKRFRRSETRLRIFYRNIGECEIPHKKGILSGLLGEIGGVMAGAVPGRTSQEDITIFDSTGIALQDLASAASILGVADQAGVGVQVDL